MDMEKTDTETLDIHWIYTGVYTGRTLECILNCILDVHWCIRDWSVYWTVYQIYTGVYWTGLDTGPYTGCILECILDQQMYTGVYWTVYQMYTGVYCTELYTGCTLECILDCILDIHWCILDWPRHWSVHWMCPDVHFTMPAVQMCPAVHLTIYQSVRCVLAVSSCVSDVSSCVPDVHSPIYQIVQLCPCTLAWTRHCTVQYTVHWTGPWARLHNTLDCGVRCVQWMSTGIYTGFEETERSTSMMFSGTSRIHIL